MTITALSLVARKARLTALRDVIDAGGGQLLFYTGSDVPASPETAATDTLLGAVPLATVSGSISHTGTVAKYTLSVPRTAFASETGLIGWVRFSDGAGNGVADRQVVEAPATGPVVVTDTQVYAGGEIQLISCVITE